MDKLNSWSITAPWWYILGAVLIALSVRAVLSLLKASEKYRDGFWRCAGTAVMGFGNSDPTHNDYLFPLYLGIIEAFVYPICIAAGAWEVIGAWIALKTLPQWKLWTDHRPAFNRFLIGNAAVVLSAFLLVRFIHVAGK
jgi:hypothetical protein